MRAALEYPRGKRHSSKHWLVMPGWQEAKANVTSIPHGNGAKLLQARQQRPRRGQSYREGDAAPKIGSHRRGPLETDRMATRQSLVTELDVRFPYGGLPSRLTALSYSAACYCQVLFKAKWIPCDSPRRIPRKWVAEQQASGANRRAKPRPPRKPRGGSANF